MGNRKWNVRVNRLMVLALVAAGAAFFPLHSPGALVHRWSFNDGTANDSVGFANGTLYGTATITNGALRLSGSSGVNRMETAAFGHVLTNKTMVVWCTLDDPSVRYNGSMLSVKGTSGFDGIVYAENAVREWRNGSDNWKRTGGSGAQETLADPNEIMLVIVHDGAAANKIKIYRNGSLYLQHNPATLTNFTTTATAVIGPRNATTEGYINGTVNEARVYDTALTASEVSALYAEGPNSNPVVDLSNVQLKHRWSFDGTANDSVGNANGTLSGTATITNGALRLSGSSPANKMATSALGDVYTNKTLVAWCTLDNPAVMYKGSVLSVLDGSAFDAIVYAERKTNQWMNGSELWYRTPADNGGAAETLADPSTIMMTITYDAAAGQKIKLYRNGAPYAAGNPTALTNFTNTAYMQIGPRGGADYINGKITEARIYGVALDVFQIAALYAQGPDSGSVWTQPAGGGWDRGANWTNNFTAGGAGNTADFSTLDITSNTVVSLNGSRTIGALVFGDHTPDYDWVLAPGTGGTLTLAAASGAPVIAVSNRTATVAVTLAGTNGFVKTGAGTLNLAAINTYQGPTVVAEGTLNVLPTLPYGVVAAYGFDDASNLGLDSSSQSNALKTSQGAPQYSAGGKFGGALYLNGSSLLRTSSGLFPSGVPTGAAPYTVSAYIKAAPTCALTGGWIGYGNNASNQCNNYRLNGTNTSVQNYWYNNDMYASLPSGSFTDGWHSVVGTWNGTDEAFYLDGVKQTQRTPATKVNVGTNDFVVGKTTADANFTGWVDDVLIGNRAFTPEEIASLNAVGIRASTLLPAATAVRVAAGATLNLNGMSQTVAGLSGSGSVTNVATLTVSGTLTPGDSASTPAILSVSSNLILSAGATLAFDYNTVSSDTVRVSGTLAVQGTNTVVLSRIGSAQPPSRITMCTFGTLTGSENLGNWTVQAAGLAGKSIKLRFDATSLYVTIAPKGTLITVW